jgi:iron complex outermembrane receptor protein
MTAAARPRATTNHALFLATAAALAAGAAPAQAQGEAATLDRVEVTAQRREQDIGDVPLAVSAIDARSLADLGVSGRDVLALGNRAPSLQAESSFGRTFPRFYIRGLGNNDFDLNASQPVSLVVDGIVMENPTLKGFPVFDLERVEVLRGPQGSLFGRNTPGGVVQFISARPSTDEEANFRLGYGTYDTVNAEAVLGGGSEASAWRVSALHQERGPISTNRALPDDRREGFEDQALRAQWLTRIGEHTEALLQLRYRDLSGGSAVYRANVFAPGSNNVVPGFNRESLDQDAVPTLDVETRGISLHLDGRWGELRWASITSWDSVEMFARGDVDGGFGATFAPPFGPGPIPFPAESGDGIPSHRQWTREFRLYSDGSGTTQWTIGTFFFYESLDIENISYDTLSGSTINGRARQSQENRSNAVFGSITHRLAHNWAVTLGSRYTLDRKDFVAERLITPFGGPTLGPISVSPDDENLSGDLALTWQANDDVQVYGRLASGYRAPAIQGRVLFGDTVSVASSEEILSAELGLKAELLDRRARFAVAAYRYTLDDAQLTAVGGGANFNTLLNAESVIGSGLEFEVLARLSRAWQVAVGGSWNDSKIDDPNLAVAPCGAGCTVFDPPGALPGTVSIDGNPLVQTPKRIAFARVDWAQTLGAGEVFASADVAHRSEVNFFLYESAEFTGKPLTEVGARVGYRWDGGRHTVSLFGRNLGDQVRAIGGVDFNNLTGFFNEPRVVGVEWQGRF